jgi:glycosyltransferase involved in cell wall biosynthesis
LRASIGDREAIRTALGIGPQTIAVVTVANYRIHKDYPNLVEAAELAASRCESLRFFAVAQGPLETETKLLVQNSALGDRFTLLGHRADAREVIAAADIFVLASRQEGLPVALMEALVLGRPVAVTAAGGVPEMVSDRCEGRVVAIEDSAALADALVELATDIAFRTQCAENSRRRGDDFDIARAQREIEDLYRQIADRSER